MPEIDVHQRRVFERVYEYRRSEGRWPPLDALQRRLTGEGEDVDLRGTVMNAAAYATIISAPDSHEQQVQLLFGGLASVPEARPLLDAYFRAIQMMVARYGDEGAEPRFTADDLRELGLEADLERELSELLVADAWTFGSGSGQAVGGGPWSYEISDAMVRQARGARTVDDIVALRLGEAPRGEESPRPRPEPLSGSPGAEPTLDADRPISAPSEDLLDRVQLARVLSAQATAQQGQGFVMGVAGPWGSGKTSLLNLMAASITEDGTGYVVRFDPWLFSSSEELVLRFLREISAQLGRRGRLGEAAARIGEYAEILAPLTALAGAPWLAPPLLVGGGLTRRRRKKQESISAHEQRAKVAAVLAQLDHRLVVLIDDLDRLQADEIRDVVRLTKLVGDFPNTTYVLAYDQARVARALGEADEREGQEFLEKIVQLTLDVPPIDPGRLARFLGASISEAVGDLDRYSFDADAYANLFASARDLFATMRDVRRYTNVLPGTLALIGEEVALADVLALEALRVRAPTSFALIVAGKQALTHTTDFGQTSAHDHERAREEVQAIVSAAGAYEEPVSEMLKRLFPAAQRYLGGSGYGSQWLATWRREKRVAHAEVLDIYLNKALPAGVLPSALVERAFDSMEDEQAFSQLLDGLDDERLETLLSRLEHYEKEFSTTHPEIPISVLYNHQVRLQRPKRYVLDLGAEYQVPRIVLRILRRIENQDQVACVTSEALSKIRTFSDRGELIRLVGYREDSGHQLVSKQDAESLERGFFDDLLDADPKPLSGERDLLRLLLWALGARATDASRRVESLVDDDDFLVHLLTAALGESVGQTMGDAAVRRSYRLSWDALTRLVPEERLVARIHELAGFARAANLDERTGVALREATRYADDPKAARANEGDEA